LITLVNFPYVQNQYLFQQALPIILSTYKTLRFQRAEYKNLNHIRVRYSPKRSS